MYTYGVYTHVISTADCYNILKLEGDEERSYNRESIVGYFVERQRSFKKFTIAYYLYKEIQILFEDRKQEFVHFC